MDAAAYAPLAGAGVFGLPSIRRDMTPARIKARPASFRGDTASPSQPMLNSKASAEIAAKTNLALTCTGPAKLESNAITVVKGSLLKLN